MHVLFQIGPRLITISSLVDKSTALGIRLTKLTIPRSANSFKGDAFSFSACSLCGMTLEFGFLPYPKLYLHFPTNKGQLPSFRSLKNDHVLAFWRFIPLHQSWSLSTDAYMANREWGFLMAMSPNAYTGGLKRNGLSTATILGYHYSRLTASVSHLLSP